MISRGGPALTNWALRRDGPAERNMTISYDPRTSSDQKHFCVAVLLDGAWAAAIYFEGNDPQRAHVTLANGVCVCRGDIWDCRRWCEEDGNLTSAGRAMTADERDDTVICR